MDAPWVDQLEDNLLLKSMLNFGGVLESMAGARESLRVVPLL